jgi:hypothetical protein
MSPPGPLARRAAAIALGLLLAAAGARAADAPLYRVDREGTLTIAELPDVLSRPEVRPHLTTGLTTGLVLTVTARGAGERRVRGAARVDVRWEPWDEVFLVAAVGADGRVRRETLPSFERLVTWWRSQALAVAVALPTDRWQVKVELSVLPFSQSEQRDAQRWLAGALGPDRAANPAQPTAGESRLTGVVDLLIATSVQRRSVVRYAWQAAPAPNGRPQR